jgi:hypothetical protein
MKSRIEQDREQYCLYALLLPRRPADAPLSQTTPRGMRYIPVPLDVVDIDGLVRIRLLKEDQRQDIDALRAAVLTLVYRATEDPT